MGDFEAVKDSGQRREFATGSVRDRAKGKGRFDLLPPEAMRRLARHFENGAAKYGDRNWELGQPLGSYLDSGIRHFFAVLAGKTDEDHLAAAAWNALACIETQHRVGLGRLPRDLDDLPHPYDSPPQVSAQAERFVYLAGPITGQDIDWDWRDIAAANLKPHGLTALSPLRDKPRGSVSHKGFVFNGKTLDLAFIDRDMEDVAKSCALLAHYPYIPDRQGIGTVWELSRANAQGKPFVVCATHSQVVEHPFIRRFAAAIEGDLIEACNRLGAIVCGTPVAPKTCEAKP